MNLSGKSSNARDAGRRRSTIGPARKSETIAAMARDVPPVVYFMRTTDGLIKIGYTTNLHQRKRHFGEGWQHVLAVVPGTMADEKAMHQRFAQHLARGREYFHPHPEVLAHINEIRAALGVPLLAA